MHVESSGFVKKLVVTGLVALVLAFGGCVSRVTPSAADGSADLSGEPYGSIFADAQGDAEQTETPVGDLAPVPETDAHSGVADALGGDSVFGAETGDDSGSPDGSADLEGPDAATKPIVGSTRIDLVLPGINRSFVQIWSVGDDQATHGLSTRADGTIFTVIDTKMVALDATGKELWSETCPQHQGCNAVSTTAAVVVIGVKAGGFIKKNTTTQATCTYAPGDLPEPQIAQQLLIAGAFVVVGTGGGNVVDVVSLADCQRVYRLSSPNGEKVGNVVADAAADLLLVSWDDPGSGSPKIVSHVLSSGAKRCDYVNSEMFRTLIANGIHFGGWSILKGANAASCAPELSFTGNYGDVRDIAFDAERDRIYALTSNNPKWGLYTLQASSLTMKSFYTEFFDNGLLSLNKMAIGDHWAFVPDGATLADGQIHVLDLTNETPTRFASFEQGRVTRLGDRLIDGGLLLTQVQRGNAVNPDTPLIAYKVGQGSFVGQMFLWGDAGGNKYCKSCLSKLAYLEVSCIPHVSTANAFSCSITNHYSRPVNGDVALVLPAQYQALSLPLKEGVATFSGTLSPEQSVDFSVTPK